MHALIAVDKIGVFPLVIKHEVLFLLTQSTDLFPLESEFLNFFSRLILIGLLPHPQQ